MIKKITAGVATLALSVGIINTANAAELTQPSSPIQEDPTQVNSSDIIITPYASSYFVSKTIKVEKGGNIPDSLFVTAESNGIKYGGSIPINPDKLISFNTYYWQVTYEGRIPRFFE